MLYSQTAHSGNAQYQATSAQAELRAAKSPFEAARLISMIVGDRYCPILKQILLLFLLALLLTLNPRLLAAQTAQPQADVLDMSLEELMNLNIDSVYGASKYKQKIADAPASITIITADDIKRYGYRTLADVLRNVPGFYVTYDRNYSYVAVRGFGRSGDYNSRILLLVDGHRTNDDIFEEALIGTEFPVDIDLIDRIEVIRGPNSSLYIASAFLGVINIVTKRNPKSQDLTVSGELASFDTYKSRITYGNQFSNVWGLVLSGTYYKSAGHHRLYFREFDSPATDYGYADDADYDEAHQVFSKLSYGALHIEGAYGSREKGIPTGSFGTVFNDSRARTVDARGYLDLAYDHNFGSDWGFMSRIYYDNYHYYGFYPFAPASAEPATVLNRDVSDGQWWGAEFAISKRLFNRQTVIVGSEYRDNFRQHQTNYNERPYFLYFDSKPTSNLWAIYSQDEVRLRHNLTLNMGLRHDQYSTFGGTTNPRAALIYQPLEHTTLKLLYGQSFRAPNAYELYYANYGQEENPRLRPETVKTAELAIEEYFPYDLQAKISAYYYPIRDLISQETDPTNGNIVYTNSKRIDMRGVEISLKKQSRAGLQVGASFSFQRAIELGSRAALTNSPHLLGQGSLSVPMFRRKLLSSMTLDYVSRRLTAERSYAGAYAVPGITLFSQALRHWEVSASLYNALSERYSDPGAIGDPEALITQDGRAFRLKLVYHF
jgi:outer membrane receptor for ferrienterochelin and colicins